MFFWPTFHPCPFHLLLFSIFSHHIIGQTPPQSLSVSLIIFLVTYILPRTPIDLFYLIKNLSACGDFAQWHECGDSHQNSTQSFWWSSSSTKARLSFFSLKINKPLITRLVNSKLFICFCEVLNLFQLKLTADKCHNPVFLIACLQSRFACFKVVVDFTC